MRGVRAKVVVASAPRTLRAATGMFETALQPAGAVKLSWKVARNAGSSQAGNIRRASVDSNWVESSSPLRPPGATYGWANSPTSLRSIWPEYASASTCRPGPSGRASESVVSWARSSLRTAATGTPSSRAVRILRLSVLKAIRAVGALTRSATVSLPLKVRASAAGAIAIR